MLIDGKAIAQALYADISVRVAALPFVPVFCDVLIGDDPASVQYVNMKAKIAERLGFKFLRADFSHAAPQADIVRKIREICNTADMAGLIVQLPIPDRFDKTSIVNAISPELDVDCLTTVNTDLFYRNALPYVPPTPGAVLRVLDSVGLPKDAVVRCVVVGQGELVGRPVSHLLQARGAQVETITRDTPAPERIASQADVLITAAGHPQLITAAWVKPGAVVIDAGTAESEGSVVGDVDLVSVARKASYVSPTPGGVGPVTVAMLFWNVLQVAEAKQVVSSET